jgi:hypothetical protein
MSSPNSASASSAAGGHAHPAGTRNIICAVPVAAFLNFTPFPAVILQGVEKSELLFNRVSLPLHSQVVVILILITGFIVPFVVLPDTFYAEADAGTRDCINRSVHTCSG